MYTPLSLLGFVIYAAIGVMSYLLIAGAQTNWWQLVTYVWIFFWPFVILLGLLYYRPVLFLVVLATFMVGLWMARRRAKGYFLHLFTARRGRRCF